MKQNIIKEKSFVFAIAVVAVCRMIQEQKKEYVLSKQLLRSGTAIGALVREAEQAESKPDFIHKMAIALKEANETEYWFDLLYDTAYLDHSHDPLFNQVKEIIKILTAIIVTSKRPKQA